MKTWERRVEEAKRKHRPKLADWGRDGFGREGSASYALWQALSAEPSDPPVGGVPRVDGRRLTAEQFVEKFEAQGKPCVLSGVQSESRALYSFAKLRRAYGSRLFKVGEDDEGYKVKLKLKYFLKYLAANTDDSPLYVFDATFDDDEVSKSILEGYQVPHVFLDDLFSLVGERRRPPYRWFLVGPARSGTCVHTDPLGTSAWNTIIRGRKRWVLFPPSTPKRVAKALDVLLPGEDDEAVNYFITLLPRLRQRLDHNSMIEFTQYAGETVFVPGGWWHAVLNMEDTIAVTQNFCSRTNFEEVWAQTRGGRKKMASSWLKRLHRHYPHLAEVAEAANTKDSFVMYAKNNVGRGGATTAEDVSETPRLPHKHASKAKMEKKENKRGLEETTHHSSSSSKTTTESNTTTSGESKSKKGRRNV